MVDGNDLENMHGFSSATSCADVCNAVSLKTLGQIEKL
jgi:hypothetical protein